MIIERFEGEYAVLETEEGMINVHRSHLPSEAREGDAVAYSSGGYALDHAVTERLRSEVSEKLHKLLTGEND